VYKYSHGVCGTGLPAVFVMIMVAYNVAEYGIGDRCLGAHNDYFLWVYIGVFMLLAFVSWPCIGTS
jgi:hypothetical protein